jgi:phosphoribosylanthranilate isomerase
MAKIAVKICGLTNYNDAALAVKLGADYIGFIFAQSPRQVDDKRVSDIIRKLSENGLLNSVKTVGVFVNESSERIKTIVEKTGIDIIQFHGDEKSDEVNTFPLPWYKALRIKSREDVDKQIDKEGRNWTCSRLLVDTAVEGMYGGTGEMLAADVACYACECVKNIGKEFFLAGGITPENVFEIIATVRPDGIDIGSGVEESKGRKSKEKLEKLFEEVNRFREVNN